MGFFGFSRSLPTWSMLLFLQLLSMATGIAGFGSMGPIAAAFGEDGFFCAIDASGKQDVVCWERNSSLTDAVYFSALPPMAALTGGEGFMCGLEANTSFAFCWNSISSGTDLVPNNYRNIQYSLIAAGKNHICAIRGSYYSNSDSGSVDCWEVQSSSNGTLVSVYNSSFSDPSVNNLVLRNIVAGEGFTCGSGGREGGITCWGPKASSLKMPSVSNTSAHLASGRDSVCGISRDSGEVFCWGETDSFSLFPNETRFVSLSAGARHFCGIRERDHGIECWGHFDASSIPTGSGFLAIASSDYTTCGVREDELILDCWEVHGPSSPDFSPPLQLCSPGLCTDSSCGEGSFVFNASILNVPEVTSLCLKKELKICSPCRSNCSEGFFPSSFCDENADRVCTACSLCQNSSCWDDCGLPASSDAQQNNGHHQMKLMIISIGSSVVGLILILMGCFLLYRVIASKNEQQHQGKTKCMPWLSKPAEEPEINNEPPPLSTASSIGTTQVFRLSDLKDATNGFKEFNELGRGSYGFVYKAVLSDGLQVAVKRANAATIIHTNSRDFEAELEILCKIRHPNIVNLLGYCVEMGERLLVYEFMPHGTLHDHLHGGLSPLNWSLRLKISMQAAKGLEYLHKDAAPPIVHRDVKTSNILLDSEWTARIADFGLLTSSDKDLNSDFRSDVYSFGIVLLEILSGRKDYDNDFTPAGIVEWAVPLIKQGKAAAIIDPNIALLRNVEPLLKLADIAELALREDPSERPSMSDVALLLEQLVRSGLTF